jgi:hypothetical protein
MRNISWDNQKSARIVTLVPPEYETTLITVELIYYFALKSFLQLFHRMSLEVFRSISLVFKKTC